MTDDTVFVPDESESHDGHRMRLRRRAEEKGILEFKPHELLELLLCYAIPRQNINVPAHMLDDRFHGLIGRVMEADESELAALPGVGAGAARWLKAVGDLCWEYSHTSLDDAPLLDNLYRLRPFLLRKYHQPGYDYEQVWQFLLSKEGRLLASHRLCDSLSWGSDPVMNDIVRNVLSSGADSVIISLCTPGRASRPEPYDLEALEALAKALDGLRVSLLDCVFVGKDVYSMHYSGEFEHSPCLNVVSRELRESYLREPTE